MAESAGLRIVVVGHGALPQALVESARMIGGALEHVSAVGLQPGVTPDTYAAQLAELLGPDTPVLILSDLRGGTPDNVANALARRRLHTAVVANVSMALLLEAALGGGDLTAEGLAPHVEAAAPQIRYLATDSSGEPER
jgi:mannose/fructose-specific phosphotransferase system component IIA